MVNKAKTIITSVMIQTCALAALCSTPIAFADTSNAVSKKTTVTSMKDFDLNRFLGRWYEIARLPMAFNPHCKTDIYSTYTLESDSKIKVDNQCLQTSGKTIHVIGTATYAKNMPSKLTVSFLPKWADWLSFGQLKYSFSVIDTDYKTALTGGTDHKYLWILSRTPQIDLATYDGYIQEAKRQGFDTSQIIINNQK